MMPCDKPLRELRLKRPMRGLPEKILKTKRDEITNCIVAKIAAAASLQNLNLRRLRGWARRKRPCGDYPRKY
jgi:hypothetical protein